MTHLDVRVSVCADVRMHVCTYARMYVCTYVRMYVYIYIYIYSCVYRSCASTLGSIAVAELNIWGRRWGKEAAGLQTIFPGMTPIGRKSHSSADRLLSHCASATLWQSARGGSFAARQRLVLCSSDPKTRSLAVNDISAAQDKVTFSLFGALDSRLSCCSEILSPLVCLSA